MSSQERFSSVVGGKGFKPIADLVPDKGLTFGILIARGVHLFATHNDTPISGSDATAKNNAEPFDTCGGCNHMFGVDNLSIHKRNEYSVSEIKMLKINYLQRYISCFYP